MPRRLRQRRPRHYPAALASDTGGVAASQPRRQACACHGGCIPTICAYLRYGFTCPQGPTGTAHGAVPPRATRARGSLCRGGQGPWTLWTADPEARGAYRALRSDDALRLRLRPLHMARGRHDRHQTPIAAPGGLLAERGMPARTLPVRDGQRITAGRWREGATLTQVAREEGAGSCPLSQSSCGSRTVMTGSPSSPGPTISFRVVSSAAVDWPSRGMR